MNLTSCSPTALRLLLASCAGDPQSPFTAEEKTAVLRCLGDLHWRPTPEDTPVSFAAVEAWYARLMAREG